MTRERGLRTLYYGMLSLLAGALGGLVLWVIQTLVTDPKAYWLFVAVGALAFARPWLAVGMLAGGAIGTGTAWFILRHPAPGKPRPEAMPLGCLVATAACGGCTGLFTGGAIAITAHLAYAVFARLFFVGVEPQDLFDASGGPVSAALRLVLEFGGIGAVLGLAAGYVVGYTPTEIAHHRRTEP